MLHHFHSSSVQSLSHVRLCDPYVEHISKLSMWPHGSPHHKAPGGSGVGGRDSAGRQLSLKISPGPPSPLPTLKPADILNLAEGSWSYAMVLTHFLCKLRMWGFVSPCIWSMAYNVLAPMWIRTLKLRQSFIVTWVEFIFWMIVKAKMDVGPICFKSSKEKETLPSPWYGERNLNLSSLDSVVA